MDKLLSKKFVRYVLVGICTFLIEYISYVLFLYILMVPLVLSITLGYMIALTFNYLVNKNWVFLSNSYSKNANSQIVMYLLLLGFNYFVNVAGTYYLTALLLVPAYASKLIVMIPIVCWNFIIYNRIIFTTTYKKELDAKEKS